MNPATSFESNQIAGIISELSEANKGFMRRYPGESNRRQAVHTVYGGAHLFKADSPKKLGAVALRSLEEYAPDAATLARAVGLSGNEKFVAMRFTTASSKNCAANRWKISGSISKTVTAIAPTRRKTVTLLQRRGKLAHGLEAGTLPPFIGIRIKPLNEDLRARSMRTLDIFITTLLQQTDGKLPDNFVITVPKVQIPAQVAAAIRLFEILERKNGLPAGALKIELMIETPQAIINERGATTLMSLVDAAEGRCGSVHFGVYDYTASCGITATYQTMGHPVCDFARQMMLVSLAGTGIHLSDGATNILPVGPHRAADGKID